MNDHLMRVALLAMGLSLPACSTMSNDMATVTVGGAPMFATKNIIENAVNSADHTTLVAAVKAAGLVDTLSGSGPFTVFAPTNAAFAKLPAGTVDTFSSLPTAQRFRQSLPTMLFLGASAPPT